MKKILSLALAAVSAAAMCIPAAAAEPVEGLEHCFYNYICNKSVNEVTPDGIYNEEEWSDAAELVINDDTIGEYGRWQSSGEPLGSDLFSCTYKFKWDENYLYLLEIRTDTNYISAFEGRDYNAKTAWNLDGTAIFFCDNDNPTTANRCDIKFYSYVDELEGPSVYIGNNNNSGTAYVGPSATGDTTYGGSIDGDTIVFELKMSWQVLRDQGYLSSDITEGTIFRFTPIIPTRDTVNDYGQWDGSSFRQINFHDCVNMPEEGSVGAEDPIYWAALTLSAADTTAAAAAAEEEAPAAEEVVETTEAPAAEDVIETTEAPAVEEVIETTETPEAAEAPQTFDFGAIAVVSAVISLAGYMISKKK